MRKSKRKTVPESIGKNFGFLEEKRRRKNKSRKLSRDIYTCIRPLSRKTLRANREKLTFVTYLGQWPIARSKKSRDLKPRKRCAQSPNRKNLFECINDPLLNSCTNTPQAKISRVNFHIFMFMSLECLINLANWIAKIKDQYSPLNKLIFNLA